MKDNETRIEFKVIDNNTGKEADIGKIALKEDWAKDLMYCDMQGFAILDNGNLILLDECGKFEYCPSERFSIQFEDSVVLSREEYEDYKKYVDICVEEYHRGQHETEVYYKNIQIPRERKETAEKWQNYITTTLLALWKDNKITTEVYNYWIVFFNDLAKQFGVEIKE